MGRHYSQLTAEERWDLARRHAAGASLRLLRYHASGVRHQKFHGVDIVTVQVEGGA